MSSTSPQRRSALPRLVPSATLEQVRLRVVPRLGLRSSAPRVPFVTLVSVLLLAGVVGLLLFNTSMQQASFDQTRLESQATNLSARQQSLQLHLERLRDPQRVALLARRQGMVPAPSAAFIDLSTSRVSGKPTVATPADNVPVRGPGISRPPALNPKPITVRMKSDKSGTRLSGESLGRQGRNADHGNRR